jgi:hypothetical protein
LARRRLTDFSRGATGHREHPSDEETRTSERGTSRQHRPFDARPVREVQRLFHGDKRSHR